MKAPLRPTPAHPARAGATLLEVTVCAAILLVGVLSATRTQLSAAQTLKAAQETQVAAGILEDAMDQVQEWRLADLLAGQTPVPLGAEWDLVPGMLTEQRMVLVAMPQGANPAVREVQLELSFRSSAGPARRMTLSGIVR